MQIVNNQYNYIDVKLWDYLERDTAELKGSTSKQKPLPIHRYADLML